MAKKKIRDGSVILNESSFQGMSVEDVITLLQKHVDQNSNAHEMYFSTIDDFEIDLVVVRDETDEERKSRLKSEKELKERAEKAKQQREQQDYQEYLKLKEKFEKK